MNKLHCVEFLSDIESEKPMLIILHGLFGSSDNWRAWAKRLESEFDVFLPDLRNHGKSYTAGGMKYRELAQDVIELIESHRGNRQKIHLLGHSMGGKVAMMAALLRRDLISSLVVGDIGPKSYPPSHQKVIEGLGALGKVKIGSRKEADEILCSYVPDSNIRLFLLKNVRKGEGKYTLSPGIVEITEAYTDILDWPEHNEEFTYTGPTLFLKGENSDYLKEADKQITAPFFPNAKMAVIEKAGHWFHVENPNRFEEELTKFYQKNSW